MLLLNKEIFEGVNFMRALTPNVSRFIRLAARLQPFLTLLFAILVQLNSLPLFADGNGTSAGSSAARMDLSPGDAIGPGGRPLIT